MSARARLTKPPPVAASDHPLEREADAHRAPSAPVIPISRAVVRPGPIHPDLSPDSLRGHGEPLPSSARRFFEHRFAYDFRSVRVHYDPAANRSARFFGARAYTYGTDVVFGAGEYAPASPRGSRLLSHELTHVIQQGLGSPQGHAPALIQRSPLSDSVKDAWAKDPTIEALLQRLGQPDVQKAQSDADVDAEIARILANSPDDLWVAQRIRQGRLGQTTGAAGPKVAGKPVQRPIEAFFFRGTSDRRALVIAGVHGTERQGIEVARMLIHDLQTKTPLYTVIVVPTLFPDNAAQGKFGVREGTTPSNRNFPKPSQDLAAAKAAGKGTAVDALGKPILPENLLLIELIERFHPERIISIHGTFGPGSAGVFYDRRSLRADEVQQAKDWVAKNAALGGPNADEAEQQLIDERLADMWEQAGKTDRDLSLAAAQMIDAATAGIKGRETRSMEREGEKLTADDKKKRLAHPSVAGNVGKTGALDFASWSGGVPGGVSLGGYAPQRGMSVFTVEPPINRASTDYPTGLDAKVDEANRKIELQAYADAVRTVLLGK